MVGATERFREDVMHILVALLGALGVVATILWRLHMAAEATKGLV